MRAPFHLVARQPGSDKDLGPFLNVITWILLITSALAVLTRLVTKRALRRRIDVDDGFVVAALVGLLPLFLITYMSLSLRTDIFVAFPLPSD